MKKLYSLIGLVAAIASATAMLSTSATSAYAVNNAQDDKNNPTFPGCAAQGPCHSEQAQINAFENCDRFYSGEVGNGQNLPAQCYNSP